MGENDDLTLNDAGNPSFPAAQQSNSEELISTVELSPAMDADHPSEGDDKPGAGNDAAAAEDKNKDENSGNDGDNKPVKDKKPASDDSDRFDKHPRFQELISSVRELKEQNRQLADKLANQPQPKVEKGNGDPPYKDISKMTDEEVLDWQSDDPKGYMDNINKMIAHQVNAGIETFRKQYSEEAEQKSLESKVEATYKEYAKNNPDFDELWDSGEIKKFMDSNPGHNAISAHMALTAEKKSKSAIDEAVKAALEKAEAARRTTRKTGSILGSGPSQTPSNPNNDNAELKTPNNFGGTTSVLARRLERMRGIG